MSRAVESGFAISCGDLPAPPQFSPWCRSRGKRMLDVVVAGAALIIALPILAIVSLLVRISSPGPALFRQRRVGRDGKDFDLLKFRTMRHGANGPGITQAGDTRVTPIGRWLRAYKLDELPQLWNVLRGDMSLVGPRPDLAEYWQRVGQHHCRALELLPGITGGATLRFRHEENELKDIPEQLLTNFYCEELLPRKIELDLEYARDASLITDLRVIARTAFAVIRK